MLLPTGGVGIGHSPLYNLREQSLTLSFPIPEGIHLHSNHNFHIISLV